MKVLREYLRMINEVGYLNAGQLIKKNTKRGNPNFQIPRTQILLKKLEKGEPLELRNGTKVNVDLKNELNGPFVQTLAQAAGVALTDEPMLHQIVKQSLAHKVKANNHKFTATNGQSYFTSDLAKTEEFGGEPNRASSASGDDESRNLVKGSAAKSTDLQESLQAATYALGSKKGNLTVDDITLENLKAVAGKFDTPITPEQMIDFLNADTASVNKKRKKQVPHGPWTISAYASPNTFLPKFPQAKPLTFHRGSPWVKRLEQKFNAIRGNDVPPDINKWNPSDMWAVASSHPLPGEEVTDIAGLNEWVHRMFDSEQVIGISLKQITKEGGAKAIKVNYPGDPDDIFRITMHRLVTNKRNDLFGSGNSNIIFESKSLLSTMLYEKRERDIAFRSFDTGQAVSGEVSIKGSSARHGKVGSGEINDIFHRYGLSPLTPPRKIEEEFGVDKEGLIGQMIDNARAVSPEAADAAEDILPELAKTLDWNKIASKFQAIEVVSKIAQLPKNKQVEVIQEMYKFASSQNALSSVFVKVYD
jgi:hypothetical protein